VNAVLRRSLKWLGGLGLALAFTPAPADPMKPLTAVLLTSPTPAADSGATAPASSPEPARLSATRTVAAGQWEALLGTRWLRRGDRLDGAQVIEIDANRVLLLRDGRRETLYLLPPLMPARPAVPPAAQAAKLAAPAAP
jgi:hypothetical protein